MASPSRSIGLCCGSILQAGLYELADAAATAGFGDITIWPTLYASAVGNGESPAAIRARLDGLGVRVIELDPICTWLPVDIPPTSPTARLAAFDEADFFRMAEALGSDALNVIRADDDTSITDEVMIHHLGALADRAEARGLRVQLEFLPWSPLADLEHALRIAAGVGRQNCGVHIDVWHHVRSGGTIERLSTIDPTLVAAVQLSDLDPEPWDDLMAETMSGRRLPGAGDGSAVRAVEALGRAGVEVPMTLEVFSRELMALSPTNAAEALARSIDSLPGAHHG